MPSKFDRRKFLKDSAVQASSIGFLPIFDKDIKISKSYSSKNNPIFNAEPKLRFGVIGLNHGHIKSMTSTIIAAGGELVSLYALEEKLAMIF